VKSKKRAPVLCASLVLERGRFYKLSKGFKVSNSLTIVSV